MKIQNFNQDCAKSYYDYSVLYCCDYNKPNLNLCNMQLLQKRFGANKVVVVGLTDSYRGVRRGTLQRLNSQAMPQGLDQS